MRIGGGRFRGQSILTPSGMATRPSSGRLKKSLFDILAPCLPGCRVLDLFAGAGGLGLEALSRGASWVTFVEKGKAAAQAIANNLQKLGVAHQAEVLRQDVGSALRLLGQRSERFDLILLDPPYRADIHESILGEISQRSLLDSQGMAVVEHHHKRALADGYGTLEKIRRVRAGESCLSFYRQP